MASCGIAEYKIAVLLGIRLETVKLFFPHELEKGAVIFSLRPSKAARRSTQKETYPTQPVPRSAFVVCGPNGEEVI